MAEPADNLPWPFDGRLLRVVGTEELPQPWLIRRHHTRDGWGIEGVPLAYPPPLMGPALEGMRTLAPGLDEMMREAGDTYSARQIRRATGQRWLGVDTSTAVLSTRSGLLLGDHLLLNTPAIADLRRTDTAGMTIGPDWLRWWQMQLLNAGGLTGLPWPLDPRAGPVTIPSDMLVQWTLDPATHFACHAASSTMLGDVRMAEAATARSATPDSPISVSDIPHAGPEPRAGRRGHPMTPWLHRVVPKRAGLQPDMASAETLLTDWEAEKDTTPLIGKERTRRLRAIVQWLRANGSGI
jgi:hypothetical protein